MFTKETAIYLFNKIYSTDKRLIDSSIFLTLKWNEFISDLYIRKLISHKKYLRWLNKR